MHIDPIQSDIVPHLTPQQLEDGLRKIGETRYHNLHPFHRLLHDGALDYEQVRAWALNRYYYQAMIPVKDAALLSRMRDAHLRLAWRQRIVDHDGQAGEKGGIEKWLVLTDGLGFARGYVTSAKGVLPAVRFAVDAYIDFVRHRDLLVAIASSLTELFSPQIIAERVSGMLAKYDFIHPQLLSYFNKRLTQAPRDADFALDYVKTHAVRPDQQQAVLAALRFKCDVLWAQLDAIYHAYVSPGHIPFDAYRPLVAKE